MLSIQVENTGARRLYEHRGWRYLHSGFVFREGQPPHVVMAKELVGRGGTTGGGAWTAPSRPLLCWLVLCVPPEGTWLIAWWGCGGAHASAV